MFQLIPAIDLINGQCVRLTQGDYGQKKVYSEDPLEIAKQFGATALLSRVPSSFLTNVRSSSFSWVFLARLSPIFPFAITNAIMAFVGVPFRWFITAGTLGMLPRTFLAVFTGISASSWSLLFARPELLRWQDVVSLLLLIVSAVGMYILGRRSFK